MSNLTFKIQDQLLVLDLNPRNSFINRLTILFISAAISPSSRAPVREDIVGRCLACLIRFYQQLYLKLVTNNVQIYVGCTRVSISPFSASLLIIIITQTLVSPGMTRDARLAGVPRYALLASEYGSVGIRSEICLYPLFRSCKMSTSHAVIMWI